MVKVAKEAEVPYPTPINSYKLLGQLANFLKDSSSIKRLVSRQ